MMVSILGYPLKGRSITRVNNIEITCPLCNMDKAIIIKKFNLDALSNLWLDSYGFNPFPKNFSGRWLEKRQCISCKIHFFNPSFYGDASFYARMAKYPWYYEESKWEYDVASEIIAQILPENLLEIGCGDGFFLEKIKSLGCVVEGVDINREAVSVCQQKGLEVEDKDVFKIEKSYDMVVLFEVLEHMEQLDKLIEFLVKKVVRRGGYIVIAVPNPEGYLKEIDGNLLDMPPHHNSCWPLATFEYLSAKYGLQTLEYRKEPLRYVHYLGLLRNLSIEYSKLHSDILVFKIFNRVQSLIVRLLSPLTFCQDRERIDGQTHLIVFKKV
jgi:2-polyprenyl-3-methyl-5-hydroxy-6-metoxy-1,4-benzoquinol methylase